MEHKETINFATSGIGSAAYVETVMLTRALKLPAKILTGYSGTDDHLAIRRGEVHASISSRSSWEAFVKNGFGHFIFQIGGNQTGRAAADGPDDRPGGQGAGRAGAEPGRHLPPDRGPARYSAGPA